MRSIAGRQHFAGLDAAFNPAAPPAGMRARVEERLFGQPESLWPAGSGAAPGSGAASQPPPWSRRRWSASSGGRCRSPTRDELIATVTPITGDVQLVAFVDRQAALLRVHPAGGDAPPGRSFELSLLPEGETVPQSLGVVPAECGSA